MPLGAWPLLFGGVVDDLPLRNKLCRRDRANFWSRTAVKAKLPQARTARRACVGHDFDLCEIVIPETGSSDHHMRAVFERRDDVGFGNLRLRIFHKNVAPIGERLSGG